MLKILLIKIGILTSKELKLLLRKVFKTRIALYDMKIEVNIGKRYFLILLGTILLLGLVVYVRAVAVDTKVFHGVDQVDWNEQIQGDINVRDSVRLGSSLYVGGQRTITDDGASILMGDIVGGDGSRGLILKAGDNNRVTITAAGDVGIGKNPSTKLDVSGNIFAAGKIYNDNGCRGVLQSTKNGENADSSINVPDECKDNDCFVFLRSNGWASGAFSYIHYKQMGYSIPGGSNIVIWDSNTVGEKRANNFGWDVPAEASGVNGDSASRLFLSLHKGLSNNIELYDDSSVEADANQWSIKNNDSPPFDIIVCD